MSLTMKLQQFESVIARAMFAGFPIIGKDGMSQSAIRRAALAGEIGGDEQSGDCAALLDLAQQDKIARKAEKQESARDKLRAEINRSGLADLLEYHPSVADKSVTLVVPGHGTLDLTAGQVSAVAAALAMFRKARAIQDEQNNAPKLQAVASK